MKKEILLWLIILLWSCSGNGSNRRSDYNNVKSISDYAENHEKVDRKADKVISLREGTDDYFGNEGFIIEYFVEEIDSTLYYSIKRNDISIINTSGRIEKKNGEYVIVLKNKNAVTLKDISSSGDDRITYDYIGFVPKIQSYLFHFSSYEGWGNILVAEEDGNMFSLRGKPYFSSGNSLFCTLRIDEEGDTCGTIEFFDGMPTCKKRLCGLWSFQILPEEACWDSDKTLYMKGYSIKDTRRDVRYYKLEIENSPHKALQDSLIHKGYKITLKQNSNGKNQIFLIDEAKKITEIIKPVYIDHEREVANICSLYILKSEKEDLIWICGENADGGLPDCSMLYDFKGMLLAYSYSVRTSAHEIQILDSKSNIDELLKQYGIKNMDEQINNGNASILNIGIW